LAAKILFRGSRAGTRGGEGVYLISKAKKPGLGAPIWFFTQETQFDGRGKEYGAVVGLTFIRKASCGLSKLFLSKRPRMDYTKTGEKWEPRTKGED